MGIISQISMKINCDFNVLQKLAKVHKFDKFMKNPLDDYFVKYSGYYSTTTVFEIKCAGYT